ncbi:PWWP domain [Sesbania bispinosa]|nr:PWWP domain [Sesbania bispinosa]
MGTVETQSQPLSEVSSPLADNAKVQGSKQEKSELREALGTLRGEDVVPANGVGFSSVGDQGLGNDGVVEVVKSSVFESRVSVLRDNDCQVFADSEMNGVSSLLQMRESGGSPVLSCEGAEKLDSSCASERRVAEAAVLSEDGTVRADGEDTRDGKKNEEGKNDDGCDGKIVTIEVPIVDTSENMDVEVEDLSDQGYEFSVGDFVWGKIKSHPWWPGRVYDPSDASDFALKLKQKNRLLVAYFGDGTFAWCHPSQLKPLEENFDDMVKQSSSRPFVNAVQEAVCEVGRLLNMKLCHSSVVKKTMSESAPLLAKNSGIKEGVIVPESGIERLSAVPIEPVELLSRVKQIAEIIDMSSILELEILKAHLSAFYLSRGGYKLPDYEDPQPVPGLEGSLMDEMVDVGTSKRAVVAPVQGPFEEDYSILPVNPKIGDLCHSPGLSGNRFNHKRKQKSIAEIMGEDKDVHTKNMEGDANDEAVDAIGSGGGKKGKGSEDAMAAKPVQKRKKLHVNTDRNVLSAENDDSGGKENSDKGTSLRSNKKRESFGNENISTVSKTETDEWKTKAQNEKGSLSRERKKSKYLSPPFTTSIGELMQENTETESLNDVASQENFSQEGSLEQELSDSSNYLTQDDENKTIDPKKIEASSLEVLSEIRILSAFKSDLITVYSKFGALNEAETDMFRTNYTARVSFLRTCDAEEAINHSQKENPFESSEVTFQLQYVSPGSMSGKHCERSKSKPLPTKKRDKTLATPSVSLSQGSEVSKLNFIKHKLEGLASILESSDGKSADDLKTKLDSKVKSLLEDVNKMVESSSS